MPRFAGGRAHGPCSSLVGRARGGKGRLGPNIAPSVTSGLWTPFGTQTGTLVQNATGILVAGGTNAAGLYVDMPFEDDATYEVTSGCEAQLSQTYRVQIYGAANKFGQTGLFGSTQAMVYAQTVRTCALTTAAGSFANRVRILFNGTGTSNNYNIRDLSIRKILF